MLFLKLAVAGALLTSVVFSGVSAVTVGPTLLNDFAAISSAAISAEATITPTVTITPTATITATVTVTPTGTITSTTNITGELKIATDIAAKYHVSVDEILKLHKEGWGFGEIVKLFEIAKASGKTLEEIEAMRKHAGWGQIEHDLNIKVTGPNSNLGSIVSGRGEKGNDNAIGKDKEKDNDNGNGKGKEKDNGNDNGKGHNK